MAPPGKKKKFIDKKHAVTFSLVHRSQRDPLAVNEEAPQRILMDIGKRREEQLNYGIAFDDDYNYLQHLREVKELFEVEVDEESHRIGKRASDVIVDPKSDKSKLLLPSSVFESAQETTVGLLNKAAPVRGPQPDLDPDILAALDEPASDDELEDNFMELANCIDEESTEHSGRAHKKKFSSHDEEDDDINSDDIDSDDLGSDDDRGVDSEDSDVDDARTRFTNCSMTSSVVPRNENLRMLDEKYFVAMEKFKREDIDDDDEEMLENSAEQTKQLERMAEQFDDFGKPVTMKDFIEKGSAWVKKRGSDESSESEEEMEMINVPAPEREWDCESILSTYSTTRNQPMTVYGPPKKEKEKPKPKSEQIKLTKRLEIPADVLPPSGPTRRQKEQTKIKLIVPPRNENETPEERKERKKAVHELQNARRLEKAATKAIFREEFNRQRKQIINQKANFQGSIIQ